MRSLWRHSRSSDSGWLSLWPPSAANALVSLSVGVFVAQWIIGPGHGGNVLEQWGALSGLTLRNGQVWRLFTHLFLQRDPYVLAADVLLLYLAGRNLEAIIGRWHFLGIFFLGGSLAGLLRALGGLYLNLGTANAVIMGETAAALAVLLAFATIMPEIEIGALIFLPVPSIRLKVRYLVTAVLLVPFLIFLYYTIRPGTSADYSGRMGPAGALVGGAIGWLYARVLGFGHRWPAREPSAPRLAASTVVRSQPEKSIAVATGGHEASNGGARASAAEGIRDETSFTERERQMSARQFISEAVDPILEKILREGLQSLTEQERAILEKAREKIARVKG